MMIGKVDDIFFTEYVLPHTGAERPEVVIGPHMGVDAGILKIGDSYMAIAEDPIFPGPTTDPEDFAWLTVHIGASDVAVMGIKPQFMTYSLLLPPGTSEEYSARLIRAISIEAEKIGIAVVGGHTGYYGAVTLPTIGGITVWGFGDSYVSSKGAQVGDKILMTKGAAIEAVGLLACELREKLQRRGVPEHLLDRAAQRLREMTVVKEALLVAEVGGVHAMHDATEGGIWRGLWEIAQASGTGLLVNKTEIILPEDIKVICEAVGLDPYAVISEGTLLMTVAPEKAEEIERMLAQADIPTAVIGEITAAEDGCLIVESDGSLQTLVPPAEDAFWGMFFGALTEVSESNSSPLTTELDKLGKEILPFITPLLPEIGANIAYAPAVSPATPENIAAFPARIIRAGNQALIPMPAALDTSYYMGGSLLKVREYYPQVRCVMNLTGSEKVRQALPLSGLKFSDMPKVVGGMQSDEEFWRDLDEMLVRSKECPDVIVTPDRTNLERVVLLLADDLEQLYNKIKSLVKVL